MTYIELTSNRRKIVDVRVEGGKLQPVSLFSDLHYGHASHNDGVRKRAVAFAKRNGSLCIGVGDWLEAGTKSSIGAGVYEQAINPQDQVDMLINEFYPIREQFVALLSGNHDDRVYRESGIDVMKNIARELHIPYFPDEAWLFISAQDEHRTLASYSLYVNHSRVTGKTPENIVNTIKRDWASRQADIRVKGHDHNVGVYPDYVEVADPHHRSIASKKNWIVLSGSCLNYQSSYAAKRPYKPIIAGQVVLYLDMRREKHDVTYECIMDDGE